MDDRVLAVVDEVVRETLGDRVVHVRERTEAVPDGTSDELLRIQVVFSGGRLDPRQTISLTRLVRARLSEIGSSVFPVFSFRSDADDKDTRSAAA